MEKRPIVLWKRIFFMLFAAALCIIGVWFNTRIITLAGVIFWIISTAINIVYSTKNCNFIKKESNLKKVDNRVKLTVIKGNKEKKEI